MHVAYWISTTIGLDPEKSKIYTKDVSRRLVVDCRTDMFYDYPVGLSRVAGPKLDCL